MKTRNILAIAVATLVFVPALGNTTQAATWHKGTPQAMRGWWRTKMRKVHDGGKRYHWTYTYMHVKKYNISGALIQSDCFYENHLKYQTGYKGKYDLYFLKGDFMPGMNGGTIYYSYYVTHHELQEINMNNLSPDTFYHRFSGKISKHTFYPYP